LNDVDAAASPEVWVFGYSHEVGYGRSCLARSQHYSVTVFVSFVDDHEHISGLRYG